MLKLGIPSVHDDAFFNPVPTPETIAAVMHAYGDAGMRAAVTLDQPNVVEYEKYPFLGTSSRPTSARHEPRTAPERRRAADRVPQLHRRLERCRDGRLRCAVSCSAPQRVTPSYLEALTDVARQHDLPFDIHILETNLQRVLGQVR